MTKQQRVFLDIHGINRQTLSLLCKYGLLPSVRSRWLDIGQVLFFCVFMDRGGVEVYNLVLRSFDKNGPVQ